MNTIEGWINTCTPELRIRLFQDRARSSAGKISRNAEPPLITGVSVSVADEKDTNGPEYAVTAAFAQGFSDVKGHYLFLNSHT